MADPQGTYRAYQRARGYAKHALARLHQDEYRALHAEEMAKEPDESTASWYRARSRAQTRLALEHDDEFRLLFEEAKADGGEIAERKLAPCGTHSAHARHLRRGEPIDEACRLAHNLAWRTRKRALAELSSLHLDAFEALHAEEMEHESGSDSRARDRARSRARSRLAQLHRTEFRELLAQEMAKEGLT